MKIIKTKRLTGILGCLLALVLTLSLTTPALAVPQAPHQFWGQVTINKLQAGEGITVLAKIGEVEYSTKVDKDGNYGYDPLFRVPADDPDTPEKEGCTNEEIIEFYVADFPTPATTWAFRIGGHDKLDLSIVVPGPQPVADFSADPLIGVEPLPVQFTQQCQDVADNPIWFWDFGDGGTSTEANPLYEYLQDDIYTVSLTVTTAYGSDTEVKTDYITVTDTEPVASFTAEPLSGDYPLLVSFTDTSDSYDDIILWEWDCSYKEDMGFIEERTGPNPTYTYEHEGTYSVALIVTEADGDFNMIVRDDLIGAPPEPVADFSADPLTGPEPLTVQFTDESQNMEDSPHWFWVFGDGGASAEQDPLHEYLQEGSYRVSLIVTTDYGSDTKVELGYIVVTDTKPVAGFTADPTSGDYPLPVSFTDTSTSYDGIVSYEWDFGDEGTSTEANPSHIYEAEGNYTAALMVTEADGDWDMAEDLITVTVPPLPPVPEADFSASPRIGPEPLTVQFTDESLNMVDNPTWLWDFGDGQTSTEPSPTHQYFADGSYTVRLTVTTAYGTDEEVKDDYIVVAETEPVASFTADPTSGDYPLEVSFISTSTSYDGIVSYEWDFGDEGTSTEANPSHIYEAEGNYTAALMVTEADGDWDMAEELITVNIPEDVTDPVIDYACIFYYTGVDAARPGDLFEVAATVTDDTAVTLVVETPFGPFPLVEEEYEGIAVYWVFEKVPEDTPPGTYELTLIAEDEAGNTATQSLELEVVLSLTAYNVWLADGWNLISLPLIPDVTDTETVLDGLSFMFEDMVRAVWGDETAAWMMPVINSVWYYDATGEYGTAGKWLYFEPMSGVGDLTEIEDGKGYWVDVVSIAGEDVPLPILTVYGVELVSGPTLPPTYAVVEGWNLIGFKETRGMHFSQYLSAVADKYARVYGYDAYGQYFYLVGEGGPDHMQPGSGYWIYMTDDGCIVP